MARKNWFMGVIIQHGSKFLYSILNSLGAQVAITLINIATGVVTARLLGSEGRGIFSAVTTWPQMLALVSIAGIGNAIVFRTRRSPEEAARIAGAAIVLWAGTCTLVVAIGIVAMPVMMRQYSAETTLIAQICLFGVFINGLQMVIKQAFVGISEFGIFNIIGILSQSSYLIALLAIAALGKLTPIGAIIALMGSGIFSLLIFLPAFFRRISPKFTKLRSEMRALISYSARGAVLDIVAALSAYSDRLVLIPLLPARELGFYVVAYSFSRLVQLALPAINSVVFSHMAGRDSDGAKLLHDHAYRFLATTLVVACLGLFIIGKPAMTLVYGQEFGVAAVLFEILVVEAALSVLAQVTIQLFMSLDRPGTVSVIQGIVMAFSVTVLCILVPLYGALGAACGMLLAAVTRLGLLLFSLKVMLKLPLPRHLLDRADLRYMFQRLGLSAS
jgi:O-antigen/teichoic acid export membrane protein